MAVANTFGSLKPMYKESYAKKTATEKPFNEPKKFKFLKLQRLLTTNIKK